MKKRKKILFLVNHDVVIYNFRLELVERLLQEGYQVHVSCPYGERIKELIDLGIIYHNIKIDRHGINPIREMKLILTYRKLMQQVRPDIVLGYTIKPNIYGAIAAKKYRIPFVANITGLGTAVENSGSKQKIIVLLYKYAFKDIQKVFFQNIENQQFFEAKQIALGKHELLPGSGVNLLKFKAEPFLDEHIVRFAFVGRIMQEKGIEQYLDAAFQIKQKYKNVEFHVCGFCEEEYNGKLKEMMNKNIIYYHGMIKDVPKFMKRMNCIVLPSYYPEGISNVLLEACATARPIITTDRSGCKEVVRDNYNGYMVPIKNVDALVHALEKYILLSSEERRQMGKNARKFVSERFDRNIVINKYIDEIEKI